MNRCGRGKDQCIEPRDRQQTFVDRPITDGTDAARDRHVKGVSKPTLTVYLPDPQKSAGAAVVVLPSSTTVVDEASGSEVGVSPEDASVDDVVEAGAFYELMVTA